MSEVAHTESQGPYLQVACFCENVVQRADGVLTLVNIVDRVSITSQGPSVPENMPKVPWVAYLVLILKAGKARGRKEVTIIPELADGTTKPPATVSVNFEGGDDRGIQVVTRTNIELEYEGLYWFHIRLDGELITKLPLRVMYSRITGGPFRGGHSIS